MRSTNLHTRETEQCTVLSFSEPMCQLIVNICFELLISNTLALAACPRCEQRRGERGGGEEEPRAGHGHRQCYLVLPSATYLATWGL